MDYLSQILGDPRLQRKIVIETKPEKGNAPPEAPLDPRSANMPQGVLDMLMMGQQQQAQPSLPPGFLEAMLGVGGGTTTPPMGNAMAGQVPMTGFNPYGG